MVIVRLMGGMGNQMFQYATGRSIAHRNNTELKMDLSVLLDRSIKREGHVFRNYDLDIFNIQEKFATPAEVSRFTSRVPSVFINRVLNRSLGHKKGYIVEPHYHFSEKVHQSGDNVFLEGYWQTRKYFEDIDGILRKEFTFREPLSEKAAMLLEKISNTQSVCVNVRRGDFLVNAMHGFTGLEYYKKAESIISDKIAEPHYFVFSDEIDWCEQNLRFFKNATFVSHEYAGKKFQDYLRLMASCKSFIIPNSSFAWWAVWLNGDRKATVIAPDQWYKGATNISDVYNPEWTII